MRTRNLGLFIAIITIVASVAEADTRTRGRERGHEGDRSRYQHRYDDRYEERSKDRKRRNDFGPYLGGALAIGIDQFDDVPSGDKYDAGFGLDVWVGSRIHRHVAVEGQLSYLDGFDLKGTGVEFSHLNGTANLKLYPFDGMVQPYAVVGAGLGRFEIQEEDGFTFSDTGGVMRVGAGVDIYLNKRIALVGGVGYLFTAGDIVDNDVLELKFGLQYRF